MNAIDTQVKAQDGRCLICNRKLTKQNVSSLAGKKGLICRVCNCGFKMFSDTPATLRRAAEYLEKQ